MMLYFVSDINANEATKSAAYNLDGAKQEQLEQKLDVSPVLNHVPQLEPAGNTACTLGNFFLGFDYYILRLDVKI